jgi:retron-type reverse transcriptase
LLKAGYLENWRWNASYSGAPQGSILSPLLSNLLLDQLDKWVETTLIPEYTRGERRRLNPQYEKLRHSAYYQSSKGRTEIGRELWKQVQKLPSQDPDDPNYRRLRYIRYCDDFLLGFIGSKAEAEEIKRKIGEFLSQELELKLSEAKTLITHAKTQKAKFLNYEIHTIHQNSRRDTTGRRCVNGNIGLRVPKQVVKSKCQRYK